MCAILDANTANEVFGDSRPPAGERFFDWLSSPRGQLVLGGKLLSELSRNSSFLDWMRNAINSARVRQYGDQDLAPHVADLARKEHRSNDAHVLALAAASGARLLYTNDRALIEDFKDRAVMARPGSVYTTARSREVTKAHRQLLARRDLCQQPP